MSTEDPKLSELNDDDRKEFLEYIRSRWAQLATASRTAQLDAAKFIALINAGGAATVLAFMGATLKERTEIAMSLQLRLALLAFVVGVVACGFAHAIESARISGLFTKWRADVAKFYADNIGFASMRRDDDARGDEFNVADFFNWFAMAGFAIGSILGMWILFEAR